MAPAVCKRPLEAVRDCNSNNWGQITGVIIIPDVLAVGVVLITAFFYWEWRQRDREPLVPLMLFRDPALTVLVVLQAVQSFVMFGQMLLNGFNLQSVRCPSLAGRSPTWPRGPRSTLSPHGEDQQAVGTGL